MELLIPGSWVRAPHQACSLSIFGSSPKYSILSFLFWLLSWIPKLGLELPSPNLLNSYFSSFAASLWFASSRISGMAVTISLCISRGAQATTCSSSLHNSWQKRSNRDTITIFLIVLQYPMAWNIWWSKFGRLVDAWENRQIKFHQCVVIVLCMLCKTVHLRSVRQIIIHQSWGKIANLPNVSCHAIPLQSNKIWYKMPSSCVHCIWIMNCRNTSLSPTQKSYCKMDMFNSDETERERERESLRSTGAHTLLSAENRR